MKEKSTLSKNLKKIRMANGYTQKDIAGYLGMELFSYKSYEQSRSKPNVVKLKKIADLYNISMDCFFKEHEKSGTNSAFRKER